MRIEDATEEQKARALELYEKLKPCLRYYGAIVWYKSRLKNYSQPSYAEFLKYYLDKSWEVNEPFIQKNRRYDSDYAAREYLREVHDYD